MERFTGEFSLVYALTRYVFFAFTLILTDFCMHLCAVLPSRRARSNRSGKCSTLNTNVMENLVDRFNFLVLCYISMYIGLMWMSNGSYIWQQRGELDNCKGWNIQFAVEICLTIFSKPEKDYCTALKKKWIFSLVFFDNTAVLNGKATETLKFK
jgi:hypothetical protein